MITDNVQVCATLRNFKSDIDYLHFEDFWIEKITEENRKLFCKELDYFINYPYDNYIVVKWYYIGRGKGQTVLRDNSVWLFSPLFRAMKLFRTGDLVMPVGFYSHNKKWHETEFHGDSYGLGYPFECKPYVFNKEDIEVFEIFRKEITAYLKFTNFSFMPYHKKSKIFNNIDTRCLLANHILLKGSWASNNPFPRIDRLIDCTTALESLYLNRGDEDKRKILSSRIAVLLSKDKDEEKQICRDIKKFYDIRSDIVHGSLMDEKGIAFLDANIYNYEDILRRSILAFLDLNLKNPSKKAVLKTLDEAILKSDLKQEIQESLKILKLAS